MKLVGGGAAGLGAAAMLPSLGSAFKVESDNALQYFNQTANNPNFEVETDGSLNLHGSDISNVGALEIENLDDVAEWIVSSTSELERAFNEIGNGETIFVGQPATPYRTSQWLDISVDNVTVIGQSRFAENGQPLIKPADGANVGGIRIGSGATTVSDIEVKRVGFHGNESTMDDTVKRLHGFIVDNATDVKLSQLFATRTHPYHKHGSGGSGISVRNQAGRVSITDVFADDIGDRFVQVAGESIHISNVRSINGFDRTVSLDVRQPDGTLYGATYATVDGVIARDNSKGSIVAISGTPSGTPKGFQVSNVAAYGTHRGAVAIRAGNRATIQNVIGEGGSRPAIASHAQKTTISNIVVTGYDPIGINIDGAAYADVSNVHVETTVGSGIRFINASYGTLGNATVISAGGHGVEIGDFGAFHASGVTARQSGDHGITVGSPSHPILLGNIYAVQSNQNTSGSVDLDLNGTDVIASGKWNTYDFSGTTRPIYNGRSHQSATPGSNAAGDDWNGNEDRAYRHDVTVEDRSVATPYDQYVVDSAGNWVKIG